MGYPRPSPTIFSSKTSTIPNENLYYLTELETQNATAMFNSVVQYRVADSELFFDLGSWSHILKL